VDVDVAMWGRVEYRFGERMGAVLIPARRANPWAGMTETLESDVEMKSGKRS
jgi:hypothetical protein